MRWRAQQLEHARAGGSRRAADFDAARGLRVPRARHAAADPHRRRLRIGGGAVDEPAVARGRTTGPCHGQVTVMALDTCPRASGPPRCAQWSDSAYSAAAVADHHDRVPSASTQRAWPSASSSSSSTAVHSSGPSSNTVRSTPTPSAKRQMAAEIAGGASAPPPASASSRPPSPRRRAARGGEQRAAMALAAAWTMPIRRTDSSATSVSPQSD